MKCYSIIFNTPQTEEWIADYIGPATNAVERHGGKILARTASHERVEGAGDHDAFRTIIEWPSKNAALAFMKDPEYAPHLEARLKGSISHHFLVDEKDDLKE
ncbi:MAG: hypothetical protein CL570_05580 [Alphaproteobacteria bacterium]|jgi:uncharacterized protein (DUF1330 family)|nr:hypothetical protein [Alphaproteobacteria bacterium]MDP7142651.1 DUF1330 domain-containing protein [Alphaproteobacteria bacterium]|tara:strand:- start:4869 stop:5174 length:306 start_codon:yes stop_codon:yes gene_type:complete